METYLRLMFLKYRYRLGFEPLCREVGDSITWRRFARIGLGGTVPHPTTLMKITTRCGERAVEGLNEALLAKAVEAKVLKLNRVRADTTVVEANVAYPTDSGLLTKGIASMGRIVGRLQRSGLATRTRFRDRSRSARRRCRAINANLRRRSDDKANDVRRINAELVVIARAAARQARAVVRNARRTLRQQGQRPRGRDRAAVNRLETMAGRVVKVAEQCAQRLAGDTPEAATRIVSMHDPDARAIRKGRIGKPVEFGYKAQLVDNDDGIIVDHNVEAGNPPDAPMLVPAIERIRARSGGTPRAVTADRGYGEHTVEDALHDVGVRLARSVGPRASAADGAPSARAWWNHAPEREGMALRIEDIEYEADGRRLVGHLAVDEARPGPRPAVLVAHEGPGLTEHAIGRAERLAELGYVAFALDYHGEGKALPLDEVMGRLGPLMGDPDRIRALATAGLDVLLAQEETDPARIAAIGFCFGGTMALELARGGADLKAVVGFHSGLATARPEDAARIRGSILVCIGAEDPLIPPEQRLAFEQEMRAGGVDWRMNLYGGAAHSFTNERAGELGLPGIEYHGPTDERSWRAMIDLFDEKLGEP